MDVLSSVGAVVAVIFSLARAVKTCEDVKNRYQDAQNSMQRVIGALDTLEGALQAIVRLMIHDAGALSSQWDTNKTLSGTFARATANFDATIKALEKDVMKIPPGEILNSSARIRYLWYESTMKIHLDQLRGQSSDLQLLLTILQTGAMSEVKGNLGDLGAAIKQLSASGVHTPIQHEGLAEYPSILDEPEDLMDLDWSDMMHKISPNDSGYQSVHTERLLKAFGVGFVSTEVSQNKQSKNHLKRNSLECESLPGTSSEIRATYLNTNIPTPGPIISQSSDEHQGSVVSGVLTDKDTPVEEIVSNFIANRDGLEKPPSSHGISAETHVITPTTSTSALLPSPQIKDNPNHAIDAQSSSALDGTCFHTDIGEKSEDMTPSEIDRPSTAPSLLLFLDRDTLHQLLKRPLHYTIETKNLDLLEAMLDEGSDINLVDDVTSQRPLALAISLNNKEATFLLLARGADFSHALDSDKEMTLLQAAAKKFSSKVLDRAILYRPRELSTPLSHVLLRVAQRFDRWDVISALVSSATTTAKISTILDQESTLFWSIKKSNISSTDLILRNGACINSKLETGPGCWVLPIHLAAQLDSFDQVGVLLTYGATILDRDSGNRTPYYFAVAQSTSTMIQFHFTELIKSLGSQTPGKGLTSTIKREVLSGVSSAVQRGDVEILKLVLKLSEEQLGTCDLTSLLLLFISVQLARKEITVFLLKHAADHLFRWEGKLAEDTPFREMKGNLHFPDNNISDYKPCRLLVRNARREMEKNKIEIQEAAETEEPNRFAESPKSPKMSETSKNPKTPKIPFRRSFFTKKS